MTGSRTIGLCLVLLSGIMSQMILKNASADEPAPEKVRTIDVLIAGGSEFDGKQVIVEKVRLRWRGSFSEDANGERYIPCVLNDNTAKDYVVYFDKKLAGVLEAPEEDHVNVYTARIVANVKVDRNGRFEYVRLHVNEITIGKTTIK